MFFLNGLLHERWGKEGQEGKKSKKARKLKGNAYLYQYLHPFFHLYIIHRTSYIISPFVSAEIALQLNYTTLHYTTLHYTSLHYTTHSALYAPIHIHIIYTYIYTHTHTHTFPSALAFALALARSNSQLPVYFCCSCCYLLLPPTCCCCLSGYLSSAIIALQLLRIAD